MKTIKILKTTILLGLGVSLLGMTLLFGGNPMPNEENQKKLFVISEGKETRVTVKAAEQFSLKIESNPTTGYSWWPQTPKEECPLLELKEKKVVEPGDEPGKQKLLGAPTYEVFTYEGLKPGQTILELQYRRPWEKEVPPLKTLIIHVTVE